MDATFAHLSSQRVLRQRNALAVLAVVLAGLTTLLFFMASSRDREIVLQPITTSPVRISSSGVSRDYLEMVTRDTALVALNRSPETLEYWMNSLLDIADPASRGALKRDLLKVMDEQQGSQISQYFTLGWIKTDPEKLTSDVGGVLHTVAGSKEVTAQPRTFHFTWSYSGLSLKLRGFGMVAKEDGAAKKEDGE